MSVGLLAAIFANALAGLKEAEALRDYRDRSSDRAERTQKAAEAALHQIYHSLRTIGLLPSVRAIDRHGTHLSDDARSSIHQIYNNLASDVAVSEVYIVAADFDPDRMDSITGGGEKPILEFDDLITAFPRESPTSKAEALKKGVKDSQEEIEIHEYRQLRQTVRSLQARYPRITKSQELDTPMVSGGEIITCDNTEYNITKSDKDRMGIIFSVPFFALDGTFKGVVAAIIRTNALRALLPDRDYALVNSETGYVVASQHGGQQQLSGAWVNKAEADPDLFFSAVLPIEIHGTISKWHLWTGHSDAGFHARSDVSVIRGIRYAGYGGGLVLALLGIGLWDWMLDRERREAEFAQWRDLSNAAVESLIILEGDRVVAANPSFKRMSGYENDPAEPLSIGQLFGDPDVRKRIVYQQARTEARLVPVYGPAIPVEIIPRDIVYGGRSCQVLAIRDLREREEAQAQIALQMAALAQLASHNEDLSKHLQQANASAATLNERLFRRVGADIHDGPVQSLAYVLLRLGRIDEAAGVKCGPAARDAEKIKSVLEQALKELRNISSGLALPELENLPLADCIRRAVLDHQSRTGNAVTTSIGELSPTVPHVFKMSLYRFVQEGLNNSSRHGKGIGLAVSATNDGQLSVSVSDRGPGFSPEDAGKDRLGLSGLRSRIEAIGGRLDVTSSPNELTTLTATFPLSACS